MLKQATSTFWAVTQPFLGAEQATVPDLKEERQGFHMNPFAEIFFCEIALFGANWPFK